MLLVIISAIPAFLAALGALIVSLRGNTRVEAVQKQGEKIHFLVDGNLTAVKADLAIAVSKIEQLSRVIAASDVVSPEVATALAQPDTLTVPRPEPIDHGKKPG